MTGVSERLDAIEARKDAAEPECWKPMPGHPNYEISDMGNVRSWSRRGREKAAPTAPRLLKPRRSNDRPYLSVSVTNQSGNAVTRTIHSLVMETWVGPRPKGMQIAHLNGNGNDNRLANLTYATAKENNGHKADHGTKHIGETVNGSKLVEWQVAEIRYLDSKGVPQGDIGRLFDISHKHVSAVVTQGWEHVDPRKDAEDITDLLDLARKQQAAIDAVRGLHTEDLFRGHLSNGCRICGNGDNGYPCPTIAAITGEGGARMTAAEYLAGSGPYEEGVA